MAGEQTFCFEIGMRERRDPPLHVHEQHEFFYCARGTGFQHTARGREDMVAGELFLFPAGQRHIGSGAADGDCLGYVLNLDPAMFAKGVDADDEAAAILEALAGRCAPGLNRIPLSDDGRRRIGAVFREMIDEQQRAAPGCRSLVKSCIQRFLVALLRDPLAGAACAGTARPRAARDRLEDVLQYLRLRFTDPIDVARMAQMAQLSRSHFHACFRRRTGTTLVEHVNRLRVAEAERLLRETDLAIVQVALHSGFASLSQFYAVFRRVTGRRPGDLRTGD